LKLITFLFFAIVAFQAIAQQNISDVRNLREGETATISGIVTNGNELGVVRYVQDTTAGIAVYDENLSAVKQGDSITITGEIHPFNNLFEITTVSSFIVHSSGNQLPSPVTITIDQIGEDYEGQLVRINDIEIENANGTFDGGKNYNFTKGSATGVFRTSFDSPVVGEVIPTGKINLVAICSQYSFEFEDTQNGYQLLPRTMDDFISGNPVNFTSPLKIYNISTGGFTLSWSTDVNSSSEVVFGLNKDQSTWTNLTSGSSSQVDDEFFHEVALSGFDPATIVYAKAFSVFNTDTAFSSLSVFATESNSSGEIKVYFNTDINGDVSTGELSKNIGRAMEDTLISYINRAEESIDFCIYNINNSGLSDISGALNSAHNRGVRVRFITCGSTAHSGMDDLITDIPTLESPHNSETGIMHNKFAIFDANSSDTEKPWIWSGSTNLTYDQVNTDANNMIFIQDQTLTKAYQIEFEEMWGGSGDQPNYSQSKFGANKIDNTPHEFIISGNRLQSYFSPSDGTNQQIINAINSADNDLDIETMLITRTDIANSIREADERGVEVHVITNASGGNSSTVNDILTAALPNGKFIFDNTASAILHHKLAIVDANFSTSDPQVITGSHNWSNSANDRNDENTLIIHNEEIANQYFQQFAYRFAENGGNLVVSAEDIEFQNINIFPNPVVNEVNITSSVPVKTIELFSITGEKIQDYNFTNQYQIAVQMSALKSGIYFLNIKTDLGNLNTYKIIKQ